MRKAKLIRKTILSLFVFRFYSLLGPYQPQSPVRVIGESCRGHFDAHHRKRDSLLPGAQVQRHHGHLVAAAEPDVRL